MKKIILALTATTFLAISTLTGCRPSTQKEDAARANVQDAKQELKEAQREATAEEWIAFKTETDLKIQNNEIRIAELKEKIKKQGKSFDALYQKKVDQMELKNREMKSRMEEYENSAHTNWESFKREFNHDLDELAKAFADLGVNNKR
jgi:hypothetical protein